MTSVANKIVNWLARWTALSVPTSLRSNTLFGIQIDPNRPKHTQANPRRVQRAPKTLQGRPKDAPGALKDLPRTLQRPPMAQK